MIYYLLDGFLYDTVEFFTLTALAFLVFCAMIVWLYKKHAGVMILLSVSGICEILMSFPSASYRLLLLKMFVPSLLLLVLHVITLIICRSQNAPTFASIVGLAALMLGWLPLLGSTLHFAAAICALVSFCMVAHDVNNQENQT